jgi:hypothetical protein
MVVYYMTDNLDSRIESIAQNFVLDLKIEFWYMKLLEPCLYGHTT